MYIYQTLTSHQLHFPVICLRVPFWLQIWDLLHLRTAIVQILSKNNWAQCEKECGHINYLLN